MIIKRIEELLPGAVLDHQALRGDQTILVVRERFTEIIDVIYAEGFQLLLDITAVDWHLRDPRFEVVYHWLNLVSQERLRVKIGVNEGQPLPSLTPKIKGADWFEREVFDMFGIKFEGHPDLKRLLLWDDYPGHPLRKDYPLNGGDVFCDDTGASFAGCARAL